jgi:hypothetical protein
VNQQHAVTLPHPDRTGPKTVGTCTCGWTVTYGWGGHGDAADVAGHHITTAGHAQPVQMQRMDGEIRVLEGLSL